MASLGTPSIAGASSAYAGQALALTASITEKTEGAVLTWEGVGCDLYNAATGGLTGDQDHDETVNLVFTAEGSYTVKVGYSDLAADNSPQYSEEKTIVVSFEPSEIGNVSVTGPATGNVDTNQSFTAANTGDAQDISYLWTAVAGDDGEVPQATFADATANPVSVTFTEPAVACKVTCTVSSTDNGIVDSPQSGFATYDSQVPAPPPEPDAELEVSLETVVTGDPFIGSALTMIPGTAQGGKEPYTTTYSWERSNQGSWHIISGFDGTTYTPKEGDDGYSIRGVTTVRDANGTELKMASLGTTAVQPPIPPIDDGLVFTGWTQYQIASLIYTYRGWHNRDLTVTPVDSRTFQITGAGRLESLGRQANTPTDGEVQAVWEWLSTRWTGTLEYKGGATFELSTSGTGRFVPSSLGSDSEAFLIGQSPKEISEAAE